MRWVDALRARFRGYTHPVAGSERGSEGESAAPPRAPVESAHAQLDAFEAPNLVAAHVRHAFFGRRGGVSEGPFSSLSFTITGGDEPARVRSNRERAAATLGVSERHLVYPSQVHGVGVLEASRALSPEGALAVEADVVVSNDPIVACGVRSADCVPVLLACAYSGWVAAVHSGWKGTVARVVEEAVRALEARGARPHSLIAAVGPHLEGCCFEVGSDVARALEGSAPNGGAALSWGPALAPGARGFTRRVDLRRLVTEQLLRAGLDPARVDHVAGCTRCDGARFFSYRREGARSGRLLSAVVARG